MSYKLLLADDSITIQKVVELILSEEDYIITSVDNGDEAFEIAKREKPDIILADIIMPRTDGYQLCEKIKKDPHTEDIPVLLLAGAYEPFDPSKASIVGADDYIIKPFESQELIKKVKDCIERGAKPIPLEEVTIAQEEDLWATIDLTGKAEVPETGLFGGIETEAIGEVLEEELIGEGLEGLEALEEIPSEEEVSPLEVEAREEILEKAPPEEKVKIEPLSAEMLKTEIREVAEKILREAASTLTPDLIKAELGRRTEEILKDAMPGIIEASSEEIRKIFKEAISRALDATVRDVVETVAWEVIPDVAERVTKGTLEASITSQFRETIEKVTWEVVPDLAEILITKEIERLKSE